MTSPQQLKYLEAMGIPVWVSRNRIVEGDLAPTTNPSLSEPKAQPKHNIDHLIEDLDKVVPVTPQAQTEPPPKDKPTTTIIKENHQQETELNELFRTTHHIAYACGSLTADWMVIGESPERGVDRKNEPFPNESGVLLSNMLRAVGIKNPRHEAYLLNIIRATDADKTVSNEALNHQLHKIIHHVKPKLVLIVGQIAAQNLLKTKEPLARLRAKKHVLPESDIPLVVTYYPTYLLNQPSDKRKAWEDLKLALHLLNH